MRTIRKIKTVFTKLPGFLLLLAATSFLLPFVLIKTSTISRDTPVLEMFDTQGPALLLAYSEERLLDMDELIEAADHIAIGIVGRVLTREYPLSYRQSEFSEEEWSNMNQNNRYVDQHKIAFHEITIEEALMGESTRGGMLPLLRIDVEHYQYVELSLLKEGQRLLFFIKEKAGNSDYAKSFDTFYTAFDDNGIFDLEGNRAYPRYAPAFKEQSGRYYNQLQDPSRPFFELDKLREAINLAK